MFRRFGPARYSLRAAWLVGVLLPLIVVAGFMGWLAVRAVERGGEERLQEETELVARAIRLPLARAVARGDHAAMQELLVSAFRIQRVYGVAVYGQDGDRLAVAGASDSGPPRGRVSELAEGERTGGYERVAGRDVYSYFVPLTGPGGQVAGLLQVTRRRAEIDEYVAGVRRRAAAALVIGALVVAAVGLAGYRRTVERPVARIRDAMRRIGRGERDLRVRAEGPTELVGLARSLNVMLDELARAEDAVTASEQAQRALEGQLRHAENLAALGRLAAGVAHEMGSPLTVIDGRAHRAQRATGTPRPVTTALEEIRDEVRRLERIIRQLLDFARAPELSPAPEPAERLVQRAVEGVAPVYDRTGTTLTLDPPPTPAVAHVDRERAQQALANLLGNGAAAAAGGRVRVSWTADRDTVTYTIDDDGPGVEPALRERIFDPFYTTKPVGAGTGLGLAIVHTVAQEHGGRIEVDDGPLGGARFRLILPAATV